MATPLRRFIEWNRKVSRWERSLVASLVPGCAPDGPLDFHTRVLPGLLKKGQRVLDVGGGKHPAIALETKLAMRLHVVGLDVSDTELLRAPPGVYDAMVVGDAGSVEIPGRFDLIFSRSVLEHVAEPQDTIVNLARALAPGGIMAHVVPCRNAPFAILNRWLGNRAARRLLFTIFPEKVDHSGFPAHYRDCTPSRLRRMCRESGLEVVTVTPYYNSGYTSFFAPLYALETLRQALMCSLRQENLAEAFSIVARAPER